MIDFSRKYTTKSISARPGSYERACRFAFFVKQYAEYF
jgi:hypothetical protein